MLTDRYTKFILTVIAIGLIANILVPILKPTPAIAQGPVKSWTDIDQAYPEKSKAFLQKGYEPFAVNTDNNHLVHIWFRK